MPNADTILRTAKLCSQQKVIFPVKELISGFPMGSGLSKNITLLREK
jgi:hypothetical protein